MWIPWAGNDYTRNGTLILLESCYDWQEEKDGPWITPQPNHPNVIVRHVIEYFHEASTTMRKLARGLTNDYYPSSDAMRAAWDRVAFTNYIPVTVGQSASAPKTPAMWQVAQQEWLMLLDSIQPSVVLVCSFATWNHLPLLDGSTYSTKPRTYDRPHGPVTCYRHQHPAFGPKWEYYRDAFAEAPVPLTPQPALPPDDALSATQTESEVLSETAIDDDAK